MCDPFAGSGGFTISYTKFINDNFNFTKEQWKNNFNNIYHFDMSEDVVKAAGLEFYSLTGFFPSVFNNFRRMNTFKNEFVNK